MESSLRMFTSLLTRIRHFQHNASFHLSQFYLTMSNILERTINNGNVLSEEKSLPQLQYKPE